MKFLKRETSHRDASSHSHRPHGTFPNQIGARVCALGTNLKVQSHGLLSGMRQAAIYCDWLSRLSLAQSTSEKRSNGGTLSVSFLSSDWNMVDLKYCKDASRSMCYYSGNQKFYDLKSCLLTCCMFFSGTKLFCFLMINPLHRLKSNNKTKH